MATPDDAEALVEFNRAMALETEGKELLPEVIGAGVRALLADPAAGFYLVAGIGRRVAGALMVTKEWSDWRNGSFRLYVERENERAQRTYESLGMKRTPYLVLEELKPGVRFFKPAG